MIHRDPEKAATERHDIIVLGGGILGAAVALEAARRSLRPLLLERSDFGGATTANSLRIVHGGLRYLQHLDVRRSLESSRERSRFLRDFPDLVRPLTCIMPLYSIGARRPWVLKLALALDRCLSGGRNRGLAQDRRLPAGRVLGVEETATLFPAVDRKGLRGGAVWSDAVITDPQRLVLEMLRWASSLGGAAINYAECNRLITARGRVEGVVARDRETGREHEYRAQVVVNCAGPWCRLLAQRLDRDVPALFRPSLALNLFLDKPALSTAGIALGPRRPGAKAYFLLPLRGRILAGTYYAPASRGPGKLHTAGAGETIPLESHVAAFLRELAEALPGLSPGAADVLRVFGGWLPAIQEGSCEPARRPMIHDHARWGGPVGLVSVSPVKLTTARSVAEKALRAALASRGVRLPLPSDAARPAPADYPALRLVCRVPPERGNATGLAADLARLECEESALHLDDMLLRRVEVDATPAELLRIAAGAASALGWGPERARLEEERLVRCLSSPFLA